MTQEHQITPPEEVIDEWEGEWHHYKGKDTYDVFMATQAARWGADQELEACCEWLKVKEWIHPEFSDELRAARRPKPLSLKEKALLQLDTLNADLGMHGLGCDLSQIRRALESLPE